MGERPFAVLRTNPLRSDRSLDKKVGAAFDEFDFINAALNTRLEVREETHTPAHYDRLILFGAKLIAHRNERNRLNGIATFVAHLTWATDAGRDVAVSTLDKIIVEMPRSHWDERTARSFFRHLINKVDEKDAGEVGVIAGRLCLSLVRRWPDLAGSAREELERALKYAQGGRAAENFGPDR
jgi:hypothetical protein